jgi:hypothetical protein
MINYKNNKITKAYAIANLKVEIASCNLHPITY